MVPSPRAVNSEVEKRVGQLSRQLDRLRLRLAAESGRRHAGGGGRAYQRRRARELAAELEEELSALTCPGEYDELAAATVADEVGLTLRQVRGLIGSGEIEAAGRAAHERVSRAELERVAALGASELLRLGRQESAEIFEEAVARLQAGDVEAAARAHRRLEGRESWAGPYAPALLVGLELARGDLGGALASVKLVYESEDRLRRVAVMSRLGRLLRGMSLSEGGARELCGRLAALAAEVVAPVARRPRRPKVRGRDDLHRQAAYLTTSVMRELRGRGCLDGAPAPDAAGRELEQGVGAAVRDALYTALYAEAFYESDASCRLYVDAARAATGEGRRSAKLLAGVSGKRGRGAR